MMQGLENYEGEEFVHGEANQMGPHHDQLEMGHVTTMNYNSGSALELEFGTSDSSDDGGDIKYVNSIKYIYQDSTSPNYS